MRGILGRHLKLPAVNAVNVIAAYRFVDIDEPAALRERLWAGAQAAALKGTVLLAHEGINFTLAGAPAPLDGWLQALQADARFLQLDIKRHAHNKPPFKRLLVKVKNEIIRMNQPTVRPQAERAPAVDAPTLARWLQQGHCDQGRALVLLDTRNRFEVDAGAFAGALDWDLQRFGDFPAALAAHAGELQGKTVVSYCTGGIRCEKAALWMRSRGVEHVHQLDGGILRYLEQPGGAPFWQGRCVVFDERGSLDASLQGQAA
jgi:UPF0176 protein